MTGFQYERFIYVILMKLIYAWVFHNIVTVNRPECASHLTERARILADGKVHIIRWSTCERAFMSFDNYYRKLSAEPVLQSTIITPGQQIE